MSEIKFAYAAHGYDYAGAIERCAGDEELLRSLLEMFLADTNYVQLMQAMYAAAFKRRTRSRAAPVCWGSPGFSTR